MFKKKLNSRSHFLRDGVEPEVWWTLYEKAQKENNTLVRILNFDMKKLTIKMEDVPGFDLSNLNEIKKLTIVERRNITAQVVEPPLP